MYNVLDWIEKFKVEKAYFVVKNRTKKRNKKTFKQVKTGQKDNKLWL